MIRKNQNILNQINVISDGIIAYAMFPLAFWLRFYVLPSGTITVPLEAYLRIGIVFVIIQLFTYIGFGLYKSFRSTSLRQELYTLWRASLLDVLIFLGWLFLGHGEHYSRSVIAIYFALNIFCLSFKRIVLRKTLRYMRKNGYNIKHIVLVGSGSMAVKYLREVNSNKDLGYDVIGYIASKTSSEMGIPYFGSIEALGSVLVRHNPDEVISAIDSLDYSFTPMIIRECENAGIKLSIIPLYMDYLPAHPQFDDLNGIPLLNVRGIPLDNLANAFVKRTADIVLSVLAIVILSPVFLICAIGVKLSSPGPVLFRQQRVGRNRELFDMLKFRSMRVNDEENSAWSTTQDERRTKFGSFIRKCSLDEIPQFFNVLAGDMSLVGPRPEIPHFVDIFKDEVPLYMVRHQVRPGITGWAQVNGLRGDTPIKKRIEYDIYYIENWSVLFDIEIMLDTVFKGKFINDEQMG